jgi:tight adherence protein B
MGLSLSAAMSAFRRRLRLMEVRIFTTTLAVHRQTGGHLALTLERMAAVMRERMTYRRQVRAATAAGRFSAMLISITGPLLFAYMFLFQPEYAYRLVTLPLGQSLLVAAVVFEVVGLVWVARLLRTEY